MGMVGLDGAARDSRSRAGRLEADQEALQKSFPAAVEVLHDAHGGLSPQRHKLTGRYNEVAGLLSDTTPDSASRRGTRSSSGTDEAHFPSFKRHAHCKAYLRLASLFSSLQTMRQ